MLSTGHLQDSVPVEYAIFGGVAAHDGARLVAAFDQQLPAQSPPELGKGRLRGVLRRLARDLEANGPLLGQERCVLQHRQSPPDQLASQPFQLHLMRVRVQHDLDAGLSLEGGEGVEPRERPL